MAMPIKIRRSIRQPFLSFCVSFIFFWEGRRVAVPFPHSIWDGDTPSLPFRNHVTKNSAFSVRGFGKKIFRRSASSGADGPINSASNFSCCRQAMTASGEGGGNFRAASSDLSRCETLKMKIKAQTAARAVQVRRHGQINSRQTNHGRVAVSATLIWDGDTPSLPIKFGAQNFVADGVELRRGGLMSFQQKVTRGFHGWFW